MPLTELEQVRRDLTLIQQRIGEAEVSLERSRRNKRTDLPQIVRAGAPCVWREDWGCWFLHFPIRTALKEVWWYEGLYSIPAERQRIFEVILYMPVREDGKCRLDTVCTLVSGLNLPHIGASAACMKSDSAPKSLTSLADYKSLHRILTRHVEGIQLSSLFSSYTYWLQREVFEVLPEEIQDWLRSDGEDPDLKEIMLRLFKNPKDAWFGSARPEPSEEFRAEEVEEEPEPPESPRSWEAVDGCTCAECVRAREAEQAPRAEPVSLDESLSILPPPSIQRRTEGLPPQAQAALEPEDLWSV